MVESSLFSRLVYWAGCFVVGREKVGGVLEEKRVVRVDGY